MTKVRFSWLNSINLHSETCPSVQFIRTKLIHTKNGLTKTQKIMDVIQMRCVVQRILSSSCLRCYEAKLNVDVWLAFFVFARSICYVCRFRNSPNWDGYFCALKSVLRKSIYVSSNSFNSGTVKLECWNLLTLHNNSPRLKVFQRNPSWIMKTPSSLVPKRIISEGVIFFNP